MKLFFQGNNVHSLLAVGDGPFPETLIVQGREFRRSTPEGNHYTHYLVERGEYEVCPMMNPFGITDKPFIALCESPIVVGATIGSLTQWSGDGWDEYEIKLIDEDGGQIFGEHESYTMEEQGKRIADGTIQSNLVIARHNDRLAGAPQATELQDD